MRTKKNIWQRIGTPLSSVLVVLLFFMTVIVGLWVVISLVRFVVG